MLLIHLHGIDKKNIDNELSAWRLNIQTLYEINLIYTSPFVSKSHIMQTADVICEQQAYLKGVGTYGNFCIFLVAFL